MKILNAKFGIPTETAGNKRLLFLYETTVLEKNGNGKDEANMGNIGFGIAKIQILAFILKRTKQTTE